MQLLLAVNPCHCFIQASHHYCCCFLIGFSSPATREVCAFEPNKIVQDVGKDEEEGQVKWKQQLCLSHVRLRSTSLAVLEVVYRPPTAEASQAASSEGAKAEVIAWAFTKIIQVCSLCVHPLNQHTPTDQHPVLHVSGVTCQAAADANCWPISCQAVTFMSECLLPYRLQHQCSVEVSGRLSRRLTAVACLPAWHVYMI